MLNNHFAAADSAELQSCRAILTPASLVPSCVCVLLPPHPAHPPSCRCRHPGLQYCLAFTPCTPCTGFKAFLRGDQHFKRMQMLHHYPVEMLQTADVAPRSLERAALRPACCQGKNCPLLNVRLHLRALSLAAELNTDRVPHCQFMFEVELLRKLYLTPCCPVDDYIWANYPLERFCNSLWGNPKSLHLLQPCKGKHLAY